LHCSPKATLAPDLQLPPGCVLSSLAAFSVASSLAITRSAGMPLLSRWVDLMAVIPRRMNSVFVLRLLTAVRTGFLMK